MVVVIGAKCIYNDFLLQPIICTMLEQKHIFPLNGEFVVIFTMVKRKQFP